MAQNFIISGEVLQLTNSTGATITSGSPVFVGRLVGVALGNIANGTSGAVKTDGVFSFAKEVGSGKGITQGAAVAWDSTNSVVTKTLSGNKFLGYATQTVGDNGTTIEVTIDELGHLMAVQADSTANNTAGIVADFNALLAKLRAVGLLATV
jgi:predicted RecA/RadA family phage recombinase